INQKKIGLDDDAYRALVRNITSGRGSSATHCTDGELAMLLGAISPQKPSPLSRTTQPRNAPTAAWKAPEHRDQRFIYALWRELCEKSTRFAKGERSCDRWAQGVLANNMQNAPSSVRMMDREQCYTVIEVLKTHIDRKAT
ncbi:MAG: regulatory protein GemA, partial [Alphaproteobacteria bacterium]|nr:regulatory protein GemA [Alphaproteobacteria bacterium]